MNPYLILGIIIAYFGLLFLISIITGKNASNSTFFTGNHNSPWYLVAFGMIGGSLSGVTFISVPGLVAVNQFSYIQMVLGYLLGYAIIALILMPMYYRLNLSSIYGYLGERFGPVAQKTGSAFFILSRSLGSSLRLFLLAKVFQLILEKFNVQLPFAVPVALSIGLIYLYTFRGGIKTIVWTDTLQTTFLLVSLGLTVWWIADDLDYGIATMVESISASKYSQIFFWDMNTKNFFLQFINGASIAVVMTGLDQDMMQKNLTCRNIKEAQINMFSFSIVLVFVNLLFVSLGAMLYLYGTQKGIIAESMVDGKYHLEMLNHITGEMVVRGTDDVFPALALDFMPPVVGILFILGIMATGYAAADSALAALTTSFCVDFLGFERKQQSDEKKLMQTRFYVHIGFSVLMFLQILVFKAMNDDAVINQIFKTAGFTYGPLLGLYAFGLFTKISIKDKWVAWVCIASVAFSILLNFITPMIGYKIGFEILIYNGLFTFLGLLAINKKSSE